MTPEETLALAQNYALDGMYWSVSVKLTTLKSIVDREPTNLYAGIVTENWDNYREGDVYEYSTGLGILVARMGNVPDAMQFIYNKLLFEGA